MAEAHDAKEQACLLIEIERCHHPPSARPLHYHCRAILANDYRAHLFRALACLRWKVADVDGQAHTQIREDLLHLNREGKLRVEPGAIQFTTSQLVLPQYRQWSLQPTFPAVVGPCGMPVRVLWK